MRKLNKQIYRVIKGFNLINFRPQYVLFGTLVQVLFLLKNSSKNGFKFLAYGRHSIDLYVLFSLLVKSREGECKQVADHPWTFSSS